MEEPIVINKYKDLVAPFVIKHKSNDTDKYVIHIEGSLRSENVVYITYYQGSSDKLQENSEFVYDDKTHVIVKPSDEDVFPHGMFIKFYNNNKKFITEEIYRKIYLLKKSNDGYNFGKPLFPNQLQKLIVKPITLAFKNPKDNIIIVNHILSTELYEVYSYASNSFTNCYLEELINMIKDNSFLGYIDELNTEDTYYVEMYNYLYGAYNGFKSHNERRHRDSAKLLMTGKSDDGREFITGGIDLDEMLSNNEKDTFKPVPEELKGISVQLAEDEFFDNIAHKKLIEAVTPKLESIDGSKIITGTKQSEGKLNYELDFEFITQMAERMAQNKGKYEPYNWKKPIPVEGLKQALFRHVMDYMANDNTLDDGREYGHLESIALNVMMINYQLKYNK